MTKAELAQYLVNLQSLINSQQATVSNASQFLAAEYDRGWTQLKDMIRKEQDNDKAG